ncbi:MAG: PEP-CTERM sorting domain-containing protein [Fimbriimonadaceae bacterium]|nr:PEP-CTERM sorting domain-containing protein [Fimbriimonadaceae bacterium]
MKSKLATLCLTLLLGTALGRAQVITTTSSVNYLATPPASIGQGDLESDTVVTLFDEHVGAVLADDLAVDIVAPGTYDSFSDLPAGPPTVAAGTWVDMYFLSADKVGVDGSMVYEGSIVFAQPILGLIVTQTGLDASDPVGSPVVTYPTGYSARNLELGGTEWVRLSADSKQLDFKFTTFNRVDQVRVVTATTVPEPGSIVLLLGGLGTLLGTRLRRK